MICDDELNHAINRLCLHALSRFWVPDSSESRVHLQRLHTQGFLRVSCPVPRQAFPVGQTFTAQRHMQTQLMTCQFPFSASFQMREQTLTDFC